ncbi:hypothetical protein OJF2_74450 [Aquisphaera giovannonii]|uniref:Proteinase inhibitor I42 chagasin domain-containing protein n=1 Tax=Aquisphaera giovannonii TaxID=406548 RepID=A0A5B9WFI7_9BACT|nr:hypothetical protein [Aquisphaera giovannonii]QEH38835.1 hypothetical protein OJF2_74450 [Aquisphaera giovannonii]
MSVGVPGGYSGWSFDLTSEATGVFREALQGVVGVEYEPFAFATQVVEGVNYSFLAKARPVVPDPQLNVAQVHVFAPLPGQGSPKLEGIEVIQP